MENMIPSADYQIRCNEGALLSGRGMFLDVEKAREYIFRHGENTRFMNFYDRGWKYNDYYQTMGLRNGVEGPKCQGKAPEVCQK